jgi:hypothetical protein
VIVSAVAALALGMAKTRSRRAADVIINWILCPMIRSHRRLRPTSGRATWSHFLEEMKDRVDALHYSAMGHDVNIVDSIFTNDHLNDRELPGVRSRVDLGCIDEEKQRASCCRSRDGRRGRNGAHRASGGGRLFPAGVVHQHELSGQQGLRSYKDLRTSLEPNLFGWLRNEVLCLGGHNQRKSPVLVLTEPAANGAWADMNRDVPPPATGCCLSVTCVGGETKDGVM